MLLAVLAAFAFAERPPALNPKGPWVVDYADAQCIAKRNFGTSEKPLVLMIKPSPTSDVIQLNLVKPGFDAMASEYDAKLALGHGAPFAVRQINFGSGKEYEIRQINLRADLAAGLNAASSIEWVGRGVNTTFVTGPLTQLMKALGECRSNLREYWNIGEEREQKLRAPVAMAGSLISLFSTKDYPRQSVVQDDSGTSSVVVLIDEKGIPRECMLDETSGIASIDAMTCAVIRERGKFKPALGADGKPVRSYFKQRVRWELP